jgi:hypothetical protein
MAKTTDLDVGYVSKLARLTCALSVNWSASPLEKGERIKVRGSTQRADDRAKTLTLAKGEGKPPDRYPPMHAGQQHLHF